MFAWPDVGMIEVKKRLEASWPRCATPSCASSKARARAAVCSYTVRRGRKTFIARAIAGEMGAAFLSVMINDILGEYIGTSESNLHKAFQKARSHAPCVLFPRRDRRPRHQASTRTQLVDAQHFAGLRPRANKNTDTSGSMVICASG